MTPASSASLVADGRRVAQIVACCLWVWQVSSCAPIPPTQVVWMDDSSGFVSRCEEFFDVASGKRSPIVLPQSGKDSGICGFDVHPGLKRTVVLTAKSNTTAEQESQFAVWVYDGITTPPAKPFSFTARLVWDNSLQPELDLHQSPTGDALLVCSLEDAVIVDLKTGRTVQPQGITLPYIFDRLFGVSPCLPQGEGFLALRRGPIPGRLTFLTEPRQFLTMHSEIVLVRWDGTVVGLGDGTPLLHYEPLFRMNLSRSLRANGSSWSGTTLSLNTGAGRLEIDASTRSIRALKDESPPSGRTSSSLAGPEVELAGGDWAIQIRERGASPPVTVSDDELFPTLVAAFDISKWFAPRRASSGYNVPLEVIARHLPTNRETVIDFSEKSHSDDPTGHPFQLFPSPDRNWVAVTYFGASDSTYNLLIDRQGEVVETFGISRREWESAAESRVRQPVPTAHWRFGKGHRFEKGGENVEVLKQPGGHLQPTRYLEFARGSSLAFSDDGLKALASYPELQFLSCPSGFETPVALNRLLSALPRLEGLEAQVSDADLAAIPNDNALRVLILERRRSLSTTAIQNLSRFPKLREVHVRGNVGERTIDYDFASLKQIQKLSIDHADAVVRLKSLGQLPNLSALLVRTPGVSQQTLDDIKLARNLEELEIYGSVNGPIRLDFLRDLKKLKRLTLALIDGREQNGKPAGAPLEGVSIEPIPSLTQLELLTLFSIRVPDSEFVALKKIPSLKHARFRECGVSRSAILQLSMAVPRCRVTIMSGPTDREPTRTYRNGGIE